MTRLKNMSSGDLFYSLVFRFREPVHAAGALVASLIDMDIKKAFKAILIGICLAAVIMTLISYGVLGHIIR